MAQVIVLVATQYKNSNEAIAFLEKKLKDFKNSKESYALLLSATGYFNVLFFY